MFVVAGGRLAWDEDAARFDPDRSDAALPVLTEPGVLPAEPLYVDVSDDAPWDPDAALFREKVTDLAAPIHGKPKYELASEDLREQRRFRRLRRAAIAGLAVLTCHRESRRRESPILQQQEAEHQRNDGDRAEAERASPRHAGRQPARRRCARLSADPRRARPRRTGRGFALHAAAQRRQHPQDHHRPHRLGG